MECMRKKYFEYFIHLKTCILNDFFSSKSFSKLVYIVIVGETWEDLQVQGCSSNVIINVNIQGKNLHSRSEPSSGLPLSFLQFFCFKKLPCVVGLEVGIAVGDEVGSGVGCGVTGAQK